MRYKYLFLPILITQINSENYAKDLLHLCAPNVAFDTMSAIIAVESSGNQNAIAVVNGARQPKQPKNSAQALKIINYLNSANANFSVGLAQINKTNFTKFKVSAESLLDPCLNLKIAEKILQDCYVRTGDIDKTLSCYYSGNPYRGFKKDFRNTSYIERIYAKSSAIKVPSLKKQKSYRTVELVEKVKLNEEELATNEKKLVTKDSIHEKDDYGEYAF